MEDLYYQLIPFKDFDYSSYLTKSLFENKKSRNLR